MAQVVAPSSTSVIQEQQAEQDRRIDTLEHMGIESRLVKVEVETAEMGWEIRTVLVGVGGLLAEAVLRIGRKAVKP